MNVLHYSFSLSACPKCHLLVCKHTSLADLDFNPDEQQPITESTISIRDNIKNISQQRSSHGTNFYILPSTTLDNRHSWTTFGTDSIESSSHLSSNTETICDNIPFANENIVHSSLPLTPILNQIVRTQSERLYQNFPKPICLTKSVSYSTIYNKSSSFSHLKQENHLLIKPPTYSNRSFLIILILILSFLLTNTFDIVLLYIYYHTNLIYFISFIGILILCEIILWINYLIQFKNISSRLLFIPFVIRLYLLYELVELMTIIFDRSFIKNDNKQILDSSLSSTTTTLETNTSEITDLPISHPQSASSYRINKQQLFHYLTVFYLVHTGFLAVINLYFWSNNFELSTKSLLHMDYFIPQWVLDDDLFLETSFMNTDTTRSSMEYLQISANDQQNFARRTLSSNWTRSIFSSSIPLSIRLPSSSAFVLTSILYYIIINYSILSTLLVLERFSFVIILLILSRLCLILTRIYTFIFLFHLHAWWLTITFIIVHLILMLTLLFDRSKLQHKRNTIFIQLILSFLTHSSIDDISINALISLENISIFLHYLYLETFSFHNETTLCLIIFIAILISLQIIGFIFDIISKKILYRTEQITKL